MGADKTLYLTRKLEDNELEAILEKLGMKYSRQSWGYSSEVDIANVGNELRLHYAYWGASHTKNAHRRAKQLIGELRRRHILRAIGRWGY